MSTGAEVLDVRENDSPTAKTTERNLANWWRNFNIEHFSVLAGSFPKIHAPKKQIEESGYRLIIRPQFQIYTTQHDENSLMNAKKRETISKKQQQKAVAHNTNYKEHTNVFHHHLTPSESMQQYREINAYSRSRIGKVNRRQLHKAATMMHRLRQEGEVARRLPKPYIAKVDANPIPKKIPENLAEKSHSKTVVIGSKIAKAKKYDKKGVRQLSKPRIFSDPNKKPLKPIDGLKKQHFTNKMILVNKGQNEFNENKSKNDTQQEDKPKESTSSTKTPKVMMPERERKSPSVSNSASQSTTSSKEIPKPLKIITNVNVKPSKQPDKPAMRQINIKSYSFPESDVASVKSNKSSPKNKSREIVSSAQSRRSLASDDQQQKSSIDNKPQLEKNLLHTLGGNSFLIVRSLESPSQNKIQESPLEKGDNKILKNIPLLLAKYGLHNTEPKYKYSEKYPGKRKVNTAHMNLSSKRSKTVVTSRSAHNKQHDLNKFKTGTVLSDGHKIEIRNKVKKYTSKSERENKCTFIYRTADAKGEPSKRLTDYLVRHSTKLAKESEEISKRLKVRTKGLDMDEFSKKILRKFQ